jgi:hypothetical protein
MQAIFLRRGARNIFCALVQPTDHRPGSSSISMLESASLPPRWIAYRYRLFLSLESYCPLGVRGSLSDELWRVGGMRPRAINVDGHPAYPQAIRKLKASGELSRRCRRAALVSWELVRYAHSVRVLASSLSMASRSQPIFF